MVPSFALLVLSLFLPLALGVFMDVPCYDDTWTYSSLSGKCYKKMADSKKQTWDKAKEQCSKFLDGVSTAKVRLLQVRSKEESVTVARIMQQAGFMEAAWLGARRRGGSAEFKWDDESEAADFSFFDWSGGAGPGDCIEFSYETDPNQDTSKWGLQLNIQNVDCSFERAYYCEHEVPRCENPPGGFNQETMRFEPSVAVPRALLRAVCKPGKFMVKKDRPPANSGPDVNTTLKEDQYYCDGTRINSGAADPMKFQTKFQYSGYPVTKCDTVTCLLFPDGLEHVKNKPTPDPGESYLEKRFGDVIELDCSYGYVSQANRNSTKATMSCEQGDVSSAKGVWNPENYQTCVAVRCNEKELQTMKPENAVLASARNYETDKAYGPQQVNEFNHYGNVITIRCLPGYLFPDRFVEKEVFCGLKKGSETEGEYFGYSGTVLPLPAKCEVTTCMFENVILKPEHNMKPQFMANNATGVWKNLTKHEGKPYALNAELRFFCQAGYETVNQNSDLNITCSNSGTWTPQLIGCIEITEKLPASSDGRFQGTKEEAKSAKQVSSIMFILIIIFLGFIVILDLTTVGRDTKTLVNNMKLQKKRIQATKQQSQRRRAEKEVSYDSTDSELQIRNRND
ncbi:hypothetical protein CLF_102296 [Clonorchis sinensis]|uniref:Sushi/SCR/CCP domain-containing protein n=1 Tax=Clonorchis sinensis TaxID=79923 RepID=G7YMZ6_CLOSI|nr:hypothetical protein CLF_102296 [Clonorchis sinensis]